MRKTIQQIETALIELDAFDGECEQALTELDEAVDVLEEHPIQAEVRCKLAGAAEDLAAIKSNDGIAKLTPSKKLTALEQRLAEAVADHPTAALAIGRLANAMAVAGL